MYMAIKNIKEKDYNLFPVSILEKTVFFDQILEIDIRIMNFAYPDC